MAMPKINFTSIDEYIAYYPPNIQPILEELRTIIKQAAPQAKEVISYNMPAFKQHGVLVYFAAYKGHIGFYPTASPIVVFKNELSSYKTSKGAIQFPIDNPLPKKLIQDIVIYRLSEDIEKAQLKKKK